MGPGQEPRTTRGVSWTWLSIQPQKLSVANHTDKAIDNVWRQWSSRRADLRTERSDGESWCERRFYRWFEPWVAANQRVLRGANCPGQGVAASRRDQELVPRACSRRPRAQWRRYPLRNTSRRGRDGALSPISLRHRPALRAGGVVGVAEVIAADRQRPPLRRIGIRTVIAQRTRCADRETTG